ncbi:MAG: YceI family protein, partial [Longimicrobiales bacterium]
GYTVGGGNTVSTTGTLSMVGTTNPVEMEMTLDSSGGAVQVQGELRVDMREWGIEPPRVLAGLLRVGPEALLEFETAVP